MTNDLSIFDLTAEIHHLKLRILYETRHAVVLRMLAQRMEDPEIKKEEFNFILNLIEELKDIDDCIAELKREIDNPIEN